jgi:hypothetical protein
MDKQKDEQRCETNIAGARGPFAEHGEHLTRQLALPDDEMAAAGGRVVGRCLGLVIKCR